MNVKTKSYIHIEPDQENRAIAGYYEVEEELRIPFGQREILCVLGYVCWDNTCCGAGGCRFVKVPGYIIDYKEEVDQKGRPISTVEQISDELEQKEIRVLLRQRIGSLQIIDF